MSGYVKELASTTNLHVSLVVVDVVSDISGDAVLSAVYSDVDWIMMR